MLDNLLTPAHVISAAWARRGQEAVLSRQPVHLPESWRLSPPRVVAVDGPVEPTSDHAPWRSWRASRLCRGLPASAPRGLHYRDCCRRLRPRGRLQPRQLACRRGSRAPHSRSAGIERAVRGHLGIGRRLAASSSTWTTWPTPASSRCSITTTREPLQPRHGRDDVHSRTGCEAIRDVVGYTGELRFDPSKPDGMPFKGLDSEPLRKLGWEPSHNLRNGLMKTYEWFVASRPT